MFMHQFGSAILLITCDRTCAISCNKDTQITVTEKYQKTSQVCIQSQASKMFHKYKRTKTSQHAK